MKTKQTGIDILHDPLWNKGMAFDYPERDRLNVRGLIPPMVKDIDDQARRFLLQMRDPTVPNVQKNLMLQDLHNRNETLYHRLLVDNVEEIAPLIYTPTVGHVCQQFGSQYVRARACAPRAQLGAQFVLRRRAILAPQVLLARGPRPLRLDDVQLAARRRPRDRRHRRLAHPRARRPRRHGMGIPIGKLALYVAAGGIAPHRVMPVMLDVARTTRRCSATPTTSAWRKTRLEGDEYFQMVDEFMQAVAAQPVDAAAVRALL